MVLRLRLQPFQGFVGISRVRPMRQDFEIALIILPGLAGTVGKLQNLCQPEGGDSIIRLIEQRFAVGTLPYGMVACGSVCGSTASVSERGGGGFFAGACVPGSWAAAPTARVSATTNTLHK